MLQNMKGSFPNEGWDAKEDGTDVAMITLWAGSDNTHQQSLDFCEWMGTSRNACFSPPLPPPSPPHIVRVWCLLQSGDGRSGNFWIAKQYQPSHLIEMIKPSNPKIVVNQQELQSFPPLNFPPLSCQSSMHLHNRRSPFHPGIELGLELVFCTSSQSTYWSLVQKKQQSRDWEKVMNSEEVRRSVGWERACLATIYGSWCALCHPKQPSIPN